ncbi:hypothetical protein D3C81_2292960 [compost metagenome]
MDRALKTNTACTRLITLIISEDKPSRSTELPISLSHRTEASLERKDGAFPPK